MAQEYKVSYKLSFDADIAQATQKIQSLQSSLSNLVTTPRATSMNSLVSELDEGIQAAAQLKIQLRDAFNTNTGKLDLGKLNNAFKTSGITLQDYKTKLTAIGPEGEKAFSELCIAIQQAEIPMRRTSELFTKFFNGLKNTAMWTLQSNAIHAFQAGLQGAVSYAEHLNKNLTDIRIVTGYSIDKMAEFANQANKAAKALSATTNEYVRGSLIYYQAGLSDNEVIERTNTTIKMAQTSGEAVEDISSYMTAIWNNFADGSKEVEYYADVISYLGAKTAASNAQIAEGMQSFAAIAKTVGLSYEYAAAALTTVIDKTQQSSSIVGNAFKTIFSRLESLKLGETLEDGVDLNKYSQALEVVGVNVLDTAGNLKDMNTVLDELAVKWETLGQAEKVALAETVGGVRQYANLISLLDNYDYFKDLVSGAGDSTGYLQSQADMYAESWEGAKNRVQTAWESIYSQLIDDQALIKLTNVFADFINTINDFIKSIGGLKGTLSTIGTILTTVFGKQLADAFRNIGYNLNVRFGDGVKRMKDMQAIAAQLQNTFDTDKANSLYSAGPKYVELNALQQKYYDLSLKMSEPEASLNKMLIERLRLRTQELDKLEKEHDLLETANIRAVTDVGGLIKAKGNGRTNIPNYQTGYKNRTANLETYSRQTSHLNNIVNLSKDFEWNNDKLPANKMKELAANIKAYQAELQKAEMSQEQAFGEKGASAVQNFVDNLENGTATMTDYASVVGEAEMASAEWYENLTVLTNILKGFGLSDEEAAEAANKLATSIENVTNKEGAIVLESTKVAHGIDTMGKSLDNAGNKTMDFSEKLVSVLGAISSVSTAVSSISSAIKTWRTDGYDSLSEGLTSIVGLITSIGFAVVTLSKIIKTAETATLGIILAVASAITAIASAIAAQIDAAKELEQNANNELVEQSNKTAELSNKYKELTNTISDLIDTYDELYDSGDSTLETMQNLEEEIPKLIEKYEELGATEESIAALERAMSIGVRTGDWSEFNKLKTQADEEVLEKNFEDSTAGVNGAIKNMILNSGASNNNGILTFKFNGSELYEKGKVIGKSGTEYSSTETAIAALLQNEFKDAINTSTYSGKGTDFGPLFAYTSTHLNADISNEKNIIQIYEQLRKVKNAAEDELSAEYLKYSDSYADLTEFLKNLEPYYQTVAEQLGGLETIALEKFNNEDADVLLKDITTFSDFAKNYDDILNKIMNQYGLASIDSAKNVLGDSDKFGEWNKAYTYFNSENGLTGEKIFGNNYNSVVSWYSGLSQRDQMAAIGIDPTISASYGAQLEQKKAEMLEQTKLTEANSDYSRLDLAEKEKEAFEILNKEMVVATEDTDRYTEATNKSSAAIKTQTNHLYAAISGQNEWVKGWEEWSSAIKNKDKDWGSYIQAMAELSDAAAQFLGISDELSQSGITLGTVFNDYVAKNLDIVYNAFSGSEEAAHEMERWVGEDLVNQLYKLDATDFKGSIDEAQSALVDGYNTIFSLLQSGDLKLGSIDGTPALTSFEEIINQLTNDVKVAEQILAAMGVNATVESVDVQQGETYWEPAVYEAGAPILTGGEENGGGSYTPLIKKKDGEWKTKTGTSTVKALKITSGDYVGGGNILTHKTGSAKTPGSVTPKKSSSSSTKEKKDSRYHENKAHISSIDRSLEKINNLESRAYGKNKLALMQKKNDLLEQEAKQYQKLADEAKSYLSGDMGKLAAYGAKFNEDGTIANYDSWYNSMSAETQEVVDELVSKYEEALETYEENAEKAAETMRQVLDNKLEMLQYAVEVKIDLDENDLKLLDFLLERASKNAADLAASIGLIGQQAEKYQDEINLYTEGIAQIEALSHEAVTEAQVKAMQDYANAILEASKNLIDLREKAFESITEAIEHYNEELERNNKLIDNNINILGHYKNIIDIIGKDRLGISDELIKQMTSTQVNAANRALEVARQAKELNEEDLKKLKAYREELIYKNAGEEELRLLDEQIRTQEDRVAEASEEWASRWEEAAQAAADAFKLMAETTANAFSKAMAGSYDNLNNLIEAYQTQKELEDLNLKEYQKAYELNKLNRQIEKSMDDTDTIKGKQALADLQQEILDKQKEGVEVNAWDVEVMQKKYELYLAQIALEEAQNTKSQVRMSRDMEGNWSYVYTADQNSIADSQQNFEDKLYELEELERTHYEEMTNLWLENMMEYQEAIAALDITDEERAQLIREKAEQLAEYYGVEIQKTVDLGKWMVDEFDVDSNQIIDNWNETVLSYQLGYNSMESANNLFLEESAKMIENIKKEYEAFETNVDNTMTSASTSTENFKEKFKEEMETVNEVADNAAEKSEELKESYNEDFDNIIIAIDDFLAQYEWDMDAVIDANVAVAQSVNDLAREYANSAADIANSANQIIQACMAAKAASDGLDNDTYRKVKEEHGTYYTYRGTDYKNYNDAVNAASTYAWEVINHGGHGAMAYGAEDIEISSIKKKEFATGGYTGEWGNSGKLAVLHEKELVLNKEDTSNLLNTIKILNDVIQTVDVSTKSASAGLGDLVTNRAGILQALGEGIEQNVVINADFPSVANHNEIEEAFNNLMNQASQYIGRK